MNKKNILFLITLTVFIFAICSASSAANTNLNVTKGSSDICGLDSNKPATGPDAYLIQVHLYNNGSSEAQNVQSTLQWTAGGQNTQYIYIDPNESYTKNIGNIAPYATKDVFYLIHIDPNAPQDRNGVPQTTQNYQISFIGTNVNTVNPIMGTLQVFGFVSQNRNNVASITPSNPTPYVGDNFTVDIYGETSSDQYIWANFPIIAYNPKVMEPTGYTVQGWNSQNPSVIVFNSKDLYVTQSNCNRFHSVWNFKAVGPGTSTIEALIIDKEKGASIHYNTDFSSMITTVTVPSLHLTKSGYYNLYCGSLVWTVNAKNDSNVTLSNVVVNDLINAASLSTYWNYYISYNNGLSWVKDGTYNPTTGNWTITQLPAGATYILTLYATPTNGKSKTYTNAATSNYNNTPVSANASIYVPDNNVQLTQTAAYINNQIVWTVTVTNTGPDPATFYVWNHNPETIYNNYEISYDGGASWVQDGTYYPDYNEWDVTGLNNTQTFILRLYATPINGTGKTYSGTAVDWFSHQATANVYVP